MSFTCRVTLSTTALLLAFSICGHAQSAGDIASAVSPGQVGGRPASSAAQSSVDSVNLYNGNLNVTIPLLPIGGRGTAGYTMVVPVQRRWSVDKNQAGPYPYSWLNAFSQLDYSPIAYSPGTLAIRRSSGTAGTCSVYGQTADYGPYLTRLVWTAPDGTQTVLRDTAFGGQPQGAGITNCQAVSTYTPADRQQTFVSTDGSDITFVADQHIQDSISSFQDDGKYASGWLYFRNGAKYQIDAHGNVITMLDRNGNKTSLTYPNGQDVSITDPLGRGIATNTNFTSNPQTGEPSWDIITYPEYQVASRTIRINHDALANALAPGQSVQTYQQLFPELSGANALRFNPDVVTSIALPNGSSYIFQYNAYGEPVQITLPTGGFIRYGYQQNYSCSGGSGGAGGDGVISIANYSGKSIYRRLTERDEYADGTNLSSQTTYHACAGADPDPNHSGRAETTVTVDFNDPTLGLLRREKHFFYGDPSAANSLPGPTSYPSWSEGLEFRAEVSDGSKTWQTQQQAWGQRPCAAGENCWLGDGITDPNTDGALPHDPQLCQANTSLDDGQSSGSIFFYDQYNNVTEQFEMGYGQAPGLGAGCPAVPNAFLRHTSNRYVTDTSYTNAAHLVSLPVSSVIYDSPTASTPIAQRSQNYDEQPPASAPGIVNNDSASTPGQRGNVTTRNEWQNTTGVNLSTRYTYDTAGNALSVTDPANHTTHYGYNDANNTYAHLTSITNAVGQGNTAAYDYNSGLLQSTTDVNNVQTVYAYSTAADASLDRLQSMTRAGLSATAFSYPSLKQITTRQDKDNLNDGAIQADQFLDGWGRETSTRQHEDAGSVIQVVKTYDALGRLRTVTNPFRSGDQPALTTYTYDPLHRTTGVQAPDGSSTTTQYAGNQATVQDAQGKARRLSTDALGRLTAVVEDPNGLKYPTSYGYDAQDNLTWVSQGSCPNCQGRWFAYDSLSRLLSATNPESGTTAYSYDDANNRYQRTDARRVTTTYQFDSLNRLSGKTYSNATPSVTYTYDNSAGANTSTYTPGHLTQVTNGVVTTYYERYDALGQIRYSEQDTPNFAFGHPYTYNLAGSLLTEQYPSGRTITTGYDGANRAAWVQGVINGVPSTQAFYIGSQNDPNSWVHYWPQGDMYYLVRGNGVWHAASYNRQLQPTESYEAIANDPNKMLFVSCPSWGENTNNGVYSICSTAPSDGQNNGTLRSYSEKQWGPGYPQTLTFNQSFTYDPLKRVQTASDSGGWSRNFNYDSFGNRWVTTPAGNTLTPDPQTPTVNVYNSATNQVSNSSYDGAGNQIGIGSFSLWYDAENRVTQVYDNLLKAQVNYLYDGDGQRVGKISAQGTTFYAYDAFGRLTEESTSFLPPTPPCRICYLSWDYLGSTRLVTNESGQVVARHDYLPFGQEVPTNTAGRNGEWNTNDDVRQRFTGQERDDTGLDFFQTRYYSSSFGRFTSPDPANAGVDLTDPQSWNGYAYVANRPLTDTDPSGLDSITGATPGFSASGQPASSGTTPGSVSWSLFNFSFSWGGTPPQVVTLRNPQANYSQVPFPAQNSGNRLDRLRDFVTQAGEITCGAFPLLCIGQGGLVPVSTQELEDWQDLLRNSQGVRAVSSSYPPFDGFANQPIRVFLYPGERIDRYGGSDFSRFFSPLGIPDAARSLPPASSGRPLRIFEVLKPFEVEAGRIAPAYGQPGLGMQYRTPITLKTLLSKGLLREVVP